MDEAGYQAYFDRSILLRAPVPKAILERWLDRLDAVPHLALDPPLWEHSFGAVLGFHADIGAPPSRVHAVDVGDLDQLASEIRARLEASQGR
ncbi:hypothetical protein [Nannocystis pusilla]|uniref:hypothetical protein n=1 Tax=Nannocystis pusilla TaxID=889268 RepID=UPI003B79F5AE